MTHYANLKTFEDSVSGTDTLSFPWRPRKIIITNDSATSELKFKFNVSEDFATLRPTETVSLEVGHRKLIVSGSGVPYRIWGIG